MAAYLDPTGQYWAEEEEEQLPSKVSCSQSVKQFIIIRNGSLPGPHWPILGKRRRERETRERDSNLGNTCKLFESLIMSLALDPTGTYWVTQLQLQLHPNSFSSNPQVKSAKLPQNASPRSRSHGHLPPSLREAAAATGQPGPGPHRTVLAKREEVASPSHPALSHTNTHTHREQLTAHRLCLRSNNSGHDWGRALVAPAWTRGDLQLPASKKVALEQHSSRARRLLYLVFFLCWCWVASRYR